jgi:hypothetical protein
LARGRCKRPRRPSARAFPFLFNFFLISSFNNYYT